MWVKTNGIPFWLVGEFTHVRTYFSGWIGGCSLGVRSGLLTRGHLKAQLGALVGALLTGELAEK